LQSVEKIFAADALKIFDLKAALNRRKLAGSPGGAEVRKQLLRWRQELAEELPKMNGRLSA
jgi:hypothetical protein